MIFDIDTIGYDLIEKILYKKSHDKYLSYVRQTKIEVVMNIIQIVRLLRVVKFYKLFVMNAFFKAKEIVFCKEAKYYYCYNNFYLYFYY